jgi:Biotin-(acetyl-CoA carboxylase) ligase
LITLGQNITIKTNNQIQITGIAESVNQSGALKVRKQNGNIEYIDYGEII